MISSSKPCKVTGVSNGGDVLSLCDDEGAVIVDDSEREETYRREAAFSIFTSVIRFELCHDEEVNSTKTSSLSHSPSHSCAALRALRSPAFLRSCAPASHAASTSTPPITSVSRGMQQDTEVIHHHEHLKSSHHTFP